MSRKRARTGKAPREFGAPSVDDAPTQGIGDPSSAALSHRGRPPCSSVPTLTTLCSRVFADNFVRLRNSSNERVWAALAGHLKSLPEALLPRLLADLVRVCPTFLTHEFLVTYFFHGPTLALTSDLPGVQTHTIRAVDRCPDLRDLELSGFAKIPDTAFASILPRLPALRRLVLRGCLLVGAKTLAAAAASCPQLQIINLNYTTVTPLALQPLLLACPRIEVLKLAGISNWTDATFAKMFCRDLDLPNLRSLKLCRLSISEVSLNALLPLCPNLRRLDISFTGVRHPFLGSYAGPLPDIEKLSLTSTPVSNADLARLLPRLSNLKSLALGALGASPRSIASIDSSMTLTDDVLLKLVPILQSYTALENLSLVGNIKLGTTATALTRLITAVGRNCKWLNLSGLPALRSHHLAGLPGAPPARLESLILNNTGINDDAAPFLSACPELARLEVAETKMTSDGLFLVLDGCPKIHTLGLRSCRGVRVGDRRRFFEAWEEHRAGS
ncbi:RNI-like protein [Mycena belliarum]|uniref:RNI-like protein n=1 Tax=Mycena belliarum TaxID=1033014 RepID=A0AAD6UGY2_9AGAR|nr:RNI-like protein [Mycena belliae]